MLSRPHHRQCPEMPTLNLGTGLVWAQEGNMLILSFLNPSPPRTLLPSSPSSSTVDERKALH